jgi:hypothetical protein
MRIPPRRWRQAAAAATTARATRPMATVAAASTPGPGQVAPTIRMNDGIHWAPVPPGPALTVPAVPVLLVPWMA